MKANSKKTEVITFRTSKETKYILDEIADMREWSVSKLCEKIVSEYAEDFRNR